MAKKTEFPPYLAAIDKKRQRVFVLAPPYLSALFTEGEWQYAQPLSDEEIAHYDLVTDPEVIKKLVEQAKEAIFAGVDSGIPRLKDEIN